MVMRDIWNTKFRGDDDDTFHKCFLGVNVHHFVCVFVRGGSLKK